MQFWQTTHRYRKKYLYLLPKIQTKTNKNELTNEFLFQVEFGKVGRTVALMCPHMPIRMEPSF
jgi:hypothetical protein